MSRTLSPYLVLVAAASALQGQSTAPDSATLALFDYDASAAMDIRIASTDQRDGYRVIDLEYASPKGGRVPAYLYVPDGSGPFAGMLLMHGMPGSRNGRSRWAAQLALAGAVVLAPSAPWARPDGPRPEPVLFTEQDRADQIQLMVDLRRGIDVLLEQPTVDPERLGYAGASYGGAMGGLLAGLEERLQAYVLVVGDGGLVSHFTGPDDQPEPLSQLPADQRERWLAAMWPIEPIRFVGHAAPAHLLFQSGRGDRLVPEEDAEAYFRAASEPKTQRWYDGGHALTQERISDQLAWLAEHLGLTPN